MQETATEGATATAATGDAESDTVEPDILEQGDFQLVLPSGELRRCSVLYILGRVVERKRPFV